MPNPWNFVQRNALAELVMPQGTDALLEPRIRDVDLVAALNTKGEGPNKVAEHLYEMLSQLRIRYALEPLNWTRQTQQVRSPAEVITTGQGTCLDLALLFASCLEEHRVHPIVVILKGHAMVAFWKNYYDQNDPPFSTYVDRDDPALVPPPDLQGLLQSKQIIPVECTGFALSRRPVSLDHSAELPLRTRELPLEGQSRRASDDRKLITYPDARSLGTIQLRTRPILFGVCIAAARRQEIRPVTDPTPPPMRLWCGGWWREPTPPPKPSPLTGQHIVGRQEEMHLLDDVLTGKLPPVVNIYGPGGIGKTVVCHKFAEECDQQGIPYATVTGSDQAVSVIGQMLSQFKDGLEQHVPEAVPEGAFEAFTRQFRDHTAVNELLEKGGGPAKLFDWAGNPHPRQLKLLLDTVVGEDRERLASYVDHRGTLERYTGNVDHRLTASFLEGVTRVVEDGKTRVVLLLDTYERLGGLDEWMCEIFVKALPPEVKVILLGRDILSGPNHDWSQYGAATLQYHELLELSEQEAKDYLSLHGLHDEKALNGVYQFTRGYPLCLALAADLSRQLRGGWEAVRGLQDPGYQDRVARELLKRILRQEAVEEVRAFLEKGIVAEWFDPGMVSFLLEVTPERGQEIYDKLSTFSFVYPHPQGLQFHETVREILKARLKRLDKEKTYKHLATRCRQYLNQNAGIGRTVRPRKR